jgi:hypothetical protein
MAKTKRKKRFVDSQVQCGILFRLFGYWALCMLFITLPLAICRTLLQPEFLFMTHMGLVWKLHWPILLALAFLLPFGAYDILKFSNRFAGPIFRLRRELKEFAKTGSMRCIKFRDQDFWRDLADGVNLLTSRIESLEKQLAARAATNPGNPADWARWSDAKSSVCD